MCQEHGPRRLSLPRCPTRRPLGLSDCQAFSTRPATGPPPPGRLDPPWPPPNPSEGADVPSWQFFLPREGIQYFPRAQGETRAEGQAVDEGQLLAGWAAGVIANLSSTVPFTLNYVDVGPDTWLEKPLEIITCISPWLSRCSRGRRAQTKDPGECRPGPISTMGHQALFGSARLVSRDTNSLK